MIFNVSKSSRSLQSSFSQRLVLLRLECDILNKIIEHLYTVLLFHAWFTHLVVRLIYILAHVPFNNARRISRFYSRTCLPEVEHLPTFPPYTSFLLSHLPAVNIRQRWCWQAPESEFSLTLHFLGFALWLRACQNTHFYARPCEILRQAALPLCPFGDYYREPQ